MLQPGSIVVVLPLRSCEPGLHKYIKWIPVDDEKTPYVIREVNSDYDVVMLEEGVIGMYGEKEIGISTERVKEILPLPPKVEIVEEVLDAPLIHQLN